MTSTANIVATFPTDVIRDLMDIAERQGITVSEFIASAVMEAIEDLNDTPEKL